MVDNGLPIAEKSFFGDTSYVNIESSKKSLKDSSNPEKEFNSLNKEIKFVTEGGGDKGGGKFLIFNYFNILLYRNKIFK